MISNFFLFAKNNFKLDKKEIYFSFLLSFFVAFLLFINIWFDNFTKNFVEKNQIYLELKPEISEEKILSLLNNLKKTRWIKEIIFIPKEQSFSDLKQKNDLNKNFLDEFYTENPFSDSFLVELENIDNFWAFFELISSEKYSSFFDISYLNDEEKKSILEISLFLSFLNKMLFFVYIIWIVFVFLILKFFFMHLFENKEEKRFYFLKIFLKFFVYFMFFINIYLLIFAFIVEKKWAFEMQYLLFSNLFFLNIIFVFLALFLSINIWILVKK